MIKNKDSIIKELAVNLAGPTAEEIVFGESLVTTGSIGDRVSASTNAFHYVTRWGFDGYQGTVTMKAGDNNDNMVFNQQNVSEIVEALLRNAKKEAFNLISSNMPLYKELLSAILKTNKMVPSEFAEICKRHGIVLKEQKVGNVILHDYKSLAEKFLKDTSHNMIKNTGHTQKYMPVVSITPETPISPEMMEKAPKLRQA